jgi:hypothetical protein
VRRRQKKTTTRKEESIQCKVFTRLLHENRSPSLPGEKEDPDQGSRTKELNVSVKMHGVHGAAVVSSHVHGAAVSSHATDAEMY